MSAPAADRPGILAPPPLLTLAAILAGWGAERLAPLPILPPGLAPLRVAAALALLALALGALVGAIAEMRRHRTSPSPYLPSTAVVTSGIYHFTRNPIYVGFMLVVAAVALAVNTWWMVVALPILFAVLRYGVVAREERYLSAKFGAPYDAYRRQVRRWL